jgi:hypothetical protein
MNNELIAEAVQALKLIDIYLHSSSVEREDQFTCDEMPDGISQQTMLGVAAEFWEPEVATDPIERIIKAKVEFGVRFVSGDKEKEKPLSEIKAVFMALYKQDGDVAEEAIDEYMKYNTPHNVWPFWREHAFRISVECKLPKPEIGLFMRGKK